MASATPSVAENYEYWLKTTSERLAEALNGQTKIGVSELCTTLRVGRSSMYRVLNREIAISPDLGFSVAEALGRSPEWLLAYDVIRERFKVSDKLGELPGRGPRVMRRLITLAERSTPSCAPELSEMAEILRKAGWTVLPPAKD